MNDHEPRPDSPERMSRTADRLQSRILEGIAVAHEQHREIDQGTAQTIAHALGRAFGRASALAEFGRSGEGSYEMLRDEYLTLYREPTTPPMIREWIDWLGTYLVQQENVGSGRQFMNEHLAPSLERLLVATTLDIGGTPRPTHLPGSLSTTAAVELAARLATLPEASDDAFWAFLTLPDVDASSESLAESFSETYVGQFDSIEDALYGLVELDEWESELERWANERGIDPTAVTLSHTIIEAHTRDIYDLIEAAGAVYAFHK